MALTHRPIPVLPASPRGKTIAKDIHRSYPTGRTEFSRGFVGAAFEICISTTDQFPAGSMAMLVTSMNVDADPSSDQHWNKIPFERIDQQNFRCTVVPHFTGLFSFSARFSVDGGASWVHDQVPEAWILVDPPQVHAMRMYTLIPGVSGTITDWIALLPLIADMGFNAIHFLPLTTMDTSQSPYSARDLFNVDPRYVDRNSPLNGLEQLEAFISTAAAMGIQLCFDLVLNHVGTDSDIATRAPDWIVPDPTSPDGLRRARYWCDKGWQPWNDLVLIDFEHPALQIRASIYRYMIDYALFWAKYANDTNGFVRFDNLHSSDKPFVDAVTTALKKEYPNVGIIAEYFTDSGTLIDTIPKWGLSLILATPWDSRFVPQLREYLKYIHSISEHVRFFMPITSHDSGSPAQEFGGIESTVPRYVAAALMGTGATGITQGVEWGVPQKIEFIGHHKKLIETQPAIFGPFLKQVNQILSEHPAFCRGSNCEFVDGYHHAIIAAYRADSRPGSKGYLLICNFDIGSEHELEVDLTPHLKTEGPLQCVDLLTQQLLTFKEPKIRLIVSPCAAHVFQLR